MVTKILHLVTISVLSHIYDHLCIPCLADIFVFGNAYDMFMLSHFHKCFNLVVMIVLSFLFGRHTSFSFFAPITFEKGHACVSRHNANAYKLLGESDKYIMLSSHIYSFTSPIMDSLFGRLFVFFFLIYASNFLKLYIHMYLQISVFTYNANAHEVLSNKS